MINVVISGNVGADAETKEVGAKGDKVTRFRLAAKSRSAQTDRKDHVETTWFSCSLWGKRGEALRPYLLKGASVTVSGNLALSLYDSQAGKAISADVNVHDVALQGSPKGDAYEPPKSRGTAVPEWDADG